MTKYVAFLRGINIVKSKRVKMEDLRRAFENIGFKNVRTVIASGNVIFETSSGNEKTLAKRVEKALPDAIGFESATVVVSMDFLRKILEKNPFEKIEFTPDIKPYVTFTRPDSKNRLKFPLNGIGYTILGYYQGAVFSVIDLASCKTPDLMLVLDKEWPGNTTRGWKTIERILK